MLHLQPVGTAACPKGAWTGVYMPWLRSWTCSAFLRSVWTTHGQVVYPGKSEGGSQWTLCLGTLPNHSSSEDHYPSALLLTLATMASNLLLLTAFFFTLPLLGCHALCTTVCSSGSPCPCMSHRVLRAVKNLADKRRLYSRFPPGVQPWPHCGRDP